MAKIEFYGFVEEQVSGQSGVFALKTAEPHSKKNEQGGYETTSRTFRDVKVGRDSGIDLGRFGKGARVKVTGAEKTEVREHQGKKLYSLVVWADSIEEQQKQGTSGPVGQGAGSQPSGSYGASTDAQAWGGQQGSYNESTPF